MRRKTTRLLRLLWRSQARTTLVVTGHDAAEKVARPVAD